MPRPLDDYIHALFNHDETEGEWYFREENDDQQKLRLDLEKDDCLLVETLDLAFNNFDTRLSKYSPWQIATGMYYVFNNSFSDMCFAFQNPKVSIEKRVSAVGGLKNIFSKVFEPHCRYALGHIDQGSGQLNHICYMIWDVTPLMHLGVKEVSREGIAVMSHCLESRNVAVIESGLHGLGHSVSDFPEARELIDRYISARFHQNTYLLDYAHKALTGSIL